MRRYYTVYTTSRIRVPRVVSFGNSHYAFCSNFRLFILSRENVCNVPGLYVFMIKWYLYSVMELCLDFKRTHSPTVFTTLNTQKHFNIFHRIDFSRPFKIIVYTYPHWVLCPTTWLHRPSTNSSYTHKTHKDTSNILNPCRRT